MSQSHNMAKSSADREEAEIPEVYRRYFELVDLGLSSEQIALDLGVPAEAMNAFIELAYAKRANQSHGHR